MSTWELWTRGGAAGEWFHRWTYPPCPHCGRKLQTCARCRGHYDTGRLCQECMFGAVCPACQRHWTWD